MGPHVRAVATSTALRAAANARGEYGDSPEGKKKGGGGSVVIVLGAAVAIYALSPGARHFYKHGRLGRLPEAR
jgi:hypothetical protein